MLFCLYQLRHHSLLTSCLEAFLEVPAAAAHPANELQDNRGAAA
jgi:hypothetical protein